MSSGPVSRRRFLGAAAVLSALPAAQGAEAAPAEPDGESDDSAYGRDSADEEAFVEDPLRRSATVFAREGAFRLHMNQEAVDLAIDAHADGTASGLAVHPRGRHTGFGAGRSPITCERAHLKR